MCTPSISGGIVFCLSVVLWVTCSYAAEGNRNSSREVSPVPLKRPDSISQTSRILALTRVDADSRSSKHLQSLGRRTGFATVTPTLRGQVFVVEIQVGTATFKAAIDTGSSDTWFVGTDFQCLNFTTRANEPQRNCAFGLTYKPSSTFEQIEDQNFNVTYGDGEFLTGIVGREEVTFAGITIKDQEIAVVDAAAWQGDGISSGLIGLGLPAMTRAYAGTDPSKDVTRMVYDPLFTHMYTQGFITPLFSLAIERSSEPSSGGQLAIGGLPPGFDGAVFTSAPFQVPTLNEANNPGGSPPFQSYVIMTNGFTCVASGNVAGRASLLPNQATSSLDSAQVRAIIDSGTTFISLPTAIAGAVNALFDPPAIFSTDRNVYLVDCSAKPPRFGVNIASETFMVNSEDLILETGRGDCMSGINNARTSQAILGDVFLKNVLAVFDVGRGEMRFAARGNP